MTANVEQIGLEEEEEKHGGGEETDGKVGLVPVKPGHDYTGKPHSTL